MSTTLVSPTTPEIALAEDLTEDRAISLWLASVYRRSGSDRTIEAYTRALDRFRAWLGPQPLAAVTISQAIGYATWLQHESCLAASSQAQALAALRSMYGFWAKLGLVAHSPFAAVPQPRTGGQTERMVSADDVRSMLAVATPGQRAVVLLLATTGLRVEEACGATWADVWTDPAGRTGLRIKGKGGKARDVKLLPAVAAALRAAEDGGELLRARTRQAVDQMLARLCRRAGVAHISAHCLRHFHATTALYAGADLLRVQEDLGHASLATTRRYLHASKGLEKTSADYAAGALGVN